MLESVSIVLGVVVSFWITYGTRHMAGEISFRLPLGLQMVSATIVGLGINLFPFSPRWLALVERYDEALASLSKLRRLPPTDERVQREYKGIVAESRYQKAIRQRRHPGATGFKLEAKSWGDLFSKKMARRVVVGCGVLFFQQFSGINAFIYYAPTLFESLGQTSEMALIMSGVFNMLQLVAVSVCFLIIDRVGRRPLAILGGGRRRYLVGHHGHPGSSLFQELESPRGCWLGSGGNGLCFYPHLWCHIRPSRMGPPFRGLS